MKTNRTLLVVFFGTVFLLSVNPLFAQENTLARLRVDLISPWLVTIKDQTRTLLLRILEIKQKGDDSFTLDASFGFIDANSRPVEAEVIQTAKERKLLFNTQSGNRYVVTQSSNGMFEGLYTDSAGITKAVSFVRLTEDELRVKTETAQKGSEIKKPAGNVPASCASFSGEWTGTWSQGGVGQYWLWVVDIDTNCVAKFAYLSHSRPPMGFATVEIKDGALPIVNRSTGGTSFFERHGDELWARYSNPAGGTNSAIFKRVR